MYALRFVTQHFIPFLSGDCISAAFLWVVLSRGMEKDIQHIRVEVEIRRGDKSQDMIIFTKFTSTTPDRNSLLLTNARTSQNIMFQQAYISHRWYSLQWVYPEAREMILTYQTWNSSNFYVQNCCELINSQRRHFCYLTYRLLWPWLVDGGTRFKPTAQSIQNTQCLPSIPWSRDPQVYLSSHRASQHYLTQLSYFHTWSCSFSRCSTIIAVE